METRVCDLRSAIPMPQRNIPAEDTLSFRAEERRSGRTSSDVVHAPAHLDREVRADVVWRASGNGRAWDETGYTRYSTMAESANTG